MPPHKLSELTPSERIADPAWAKRYNLMLEGDLAFYCSEILRGPPMYGGKFLLGPHHVRWSRVVREEERILALAARDHGKSHFYCFGYPLWRVDKASPGQLGYIFSATEQQAYDHLEKVVMEIVGGGENGGPNPKLQHLMEGPGPNGKKKTLQVSRSRVLFPNGSQIRARGFGTNVRGGHPYWAVADDVGQDEWIYSDVVREKAIDYFLSAIRPMVVPGGQLIVVGTPFHALDLYNTLEKTGVYRVIKDPAISKSGEILWPARYDAARLDTTRKELANDLRFSREYLCQPISDAASLFPGYLFEAPGIKQPYSLGLPGAVWEDRGASVFAGVDLALSSSAGADYFCFFALALMPDGTRYIVDIVRRKGLGFQDQLDLIKVLARKYDCAMIYCEANQFQRVVTDEVIRTSDVPIKAFYTTGKRKVTTSRFGMTQTYSAAKNAFDQGVPSLRMLFENGKIRIPYAPESRDTIDTWIEEMRSFGWADGKLQGVGAHDDTVMALWIADHACRTGGVSFSFGGDDEEGLVSDWESWAGEEEEGGEYDPLGVFDQGDWKPKEGVGINDPFIR